jgi:hypothetical protein
MAKKIQERRKYKRIETGIIIGFQPEGDRDFYPSLIINMSQGGMLLKSPRSFPVDLTLNITVSKNDYFPQEIRMRGRVMRCEKIIDGSIYHLAVEMTRESQGFSEAIDGFYSKLMKIKKKYM